MWAKSICLGEKVFLPKMIKPIYKSVAMIISNKNYLILNHNQRNKHINKY